MTRIAEYFRTISVLGLSAVISADDGVLLDTACAAYADPVDPTSPPVMRLRLTLGPDATPDAPPTIAVEGARLSISGPGVVGAAEASGQAVGLVAARLTADPAAVVELTDTLLLFMATRNGRVPVHAAGVRFGDLAVILAGPSGSGKSTLALAAMKRGLDLLSDDTVYIQLRPAIRVWGLRRPIHVFPQDAPRFTQGVRVRAGKSKAIVPPGPGVGGLAAADRAELIVLERTGRIALEPIDASAALERLLQLEPGFDLLRRESEEALAALASSGAWRLTLDDDPGAAIDVLLKRFASSS